MQHCALSVWKLSSFASAAPVGSNVSTIALPGFCSIHPLELSAGSMQICTLAQYGPSRWLSAWNIIDICTYVFQILISIAYFGRCAASSTGA